MHDCAANQFSSEHLALIQTPVPVAMPSLEKVDQVILSQTLLYWRKLWIR
jgi:hypothetical protein